MPQVGLNTAEDWKNRLGEALKPGAGRLVFVVGAGLSWDGDGGVWGVSEIVEHIRRIFPKLTFSVEPPPAAYQAALAKLKASHGARAVERIIRRAVLEAAREGEGRRKAVAEVASEDGTSACRSLQGDPDAWHVPRGAAALADLLVEAANRAKQDPRVKYPCVLSTNFDGLLELALDKRGAPYRQVVVAGNEFPRDLDHQVSILHLHGYWLSEPTLHDPSALQARRTSLEAALRALLHRAQVFVLGYGGWNDIIFDTTSTLLERQESESLPDVMWAFHEPEEKTQADDANPKSACGHVIASFSNPIALSRTSFYCGVDVHRHLPEVVDDLLGTTAPAVAAGPTRGVAATPTLLGLIRTLVNTVPKPLQPGFLGLQADAEKSQPVNLVGVVAMCCVVLQEGRMAPSAEQAFTEAAWDLIAFMVRELVGSIKGGLARAAKVERQGEILRVPARTHFLVALLLAKNPDPRYLLMPDSVGPVSLHDHSLGGRSIPLETGPAEIDRMALFEALLWKDLFPNVPAYTLGCKESACLVDTCALECNKRILYGRLKADAAMGRPHFWVIDPRRTEQWKEIAAKAKEVVFVEPGVGATTGIDEDQLAQLINRFLELTASKEIP